MPHVGLHVGSDARCQGNAADRIRLRGVVAEFAHKLAEEAIYSAGVAEQFL
jgi:hypothetical protein